METILQEVSGGGFNHITANNGGGGGGGGGGTNGQLSAAISELEALFSKVIHTQKHIKNRMHRFKDEIAKSLSEVKTIIEDNSKKLLSTFFEGRKRKFIGFNVGTDFFDIEKDFESMYYDQFEVSPPTHIDNGFMALSSLTDKMVNEHTDHNDRGGGVGDHGCRVPQFLRKLYDMVEKQEIDSLISWKLPHRDSFIISDINKFATQVLPIYFTHTNFSSFNTQLNIYGFRKVSWERHQYANEWFQGGRYDLLANIKRREKNPLLTRSTIKFSLIEVEMFKGQLKSIEQEQENKIICVSNHEEQMKRSIHEFKETVINMANIVNRIILTSKDNLEIVKKPKRGHEDSVIDDLLGNIEGQDLDVDESGGKDMASIHNNNLKAHAIFLDLEAMVKNMEMEVNWIEEKEMQQYSSFCLGRESETEIETKFSLDEASCS